MAALTAVADSFTTQSKRLLDPIDRISEILFGLLMAVTIVGSLAIATAGREDVRTVLYAAFGCNLAWGLADAVMFLIRTLTEKTRKYVLVQRLRGADTASAHRMIQLALPAGVASLLTATEFEAVRTRVLALPEQKRPRFSGQDWLTAFGVFLLVVVATFPVVLPFVLIADLPMAMKVSRYVTLGMLFAAGHSLGKHAGHARPFLTGVLMAMVGAALILAIMALGG